ncbi:MAG: polymer-forming cytoskeletal protein [Candidatus Latescibacteria bacterium]|nr:polymer-forming cytoskeletal protein [Candidatus Latescibacterota bacterium]MCK5327401.1 polymer-forming cytoskeletal protein [Candidatus Latescibacterota bacterium]MCK5525674.1 polymer-forming cytoskeletal protein [Candidatus Latescibacterota bacterium]
MAKDDAKREIGAMNTVIGKGSAFEGTLQVESSIRVDGVVRGKLTASDTLVVGKEGEVKADVKVKNAIVGGKLIGTLEASNKVVLESRSLLLGDLKAKVLVVAEGAVFRGKSESGDGDPMLVEESVGPVHKAGSGGEQAASGAAGEAKNEGDGES